MSRNDAETTVVTAFNHLADKVGMEPLDMWELIGESEGFMPDTPESLADDALAAAMDAADADDESDDADTDDSPSNTSDMSDDKGRSLGPLATAREIVPEHDITKNDFAKYRSLVHDAGDFDDEKVRDAWHTLRDEGVIGEGDADDESDASDSDADDEGDKPTAAETMLANGPCIATRGAKTDEPCNLGAHEEGDHFCAKHKGVSSPNIADDALSARQEWANGEDITGYVEEVTGEEVSA